MCKIEFSTKGWQAILAEDFTFSNVRLVTRAICNVLRRQQTYSDNFPPRLVIGYDNRFLGRKFAHEVAEVVIRNGFDAYIIKVPEPTPVIISGIKELVVTGGILITGSPLGAEYNGIKFITARTTATSEEIAAYIEDECARLEEIDVPELPISQGEIVDFSPKEEYFRQIQKMVDLKAIKQLGIDVTVDYMHGVSSGYFNKAFSSYSGVVRELRAEQHMDFKGVKPNLTGANLDSLMQVVLTPRATLQVGIALDGDGSNLQIIDASGNIVDHDLLFGLLIDYLVVNRGWKGSVVKAKKHGEFSHKVAKYHKLSVNEMKENDIYLIGEEMRLKNAIIGSDLAGGYIFQNHILERDGILAGLMVLEIIATYKQNLNILINNLKSKIAK